MIIKTISDWFLDKNSFTSQNYHSHSMKNWIFLELPVAETTAQYWEKRDMNPNVFIRH